MRQTLKIGGFETDQEVELQATAEFTSDMAQTLRTYFVGYQVDGIVTIEVTNQGLWLRNPYTGGRQFLGLARLDNDASTPH